MCERIALPNQFAAEREFMPACTWWKFNPSFNVPEHRYVPAVRVHEGQSEAVMMRWGLIPSWAEGRPMAGSAACVDLEDIASSAAHREPWLAGRRCILPVSGYYEWQLTPAKYRQPYFVRLTGRPVFGLAAVWDRSESEDGDVVESCSVICVPANELLAGIASQRRMPAILKRRDYDTWLRGAPAEAGAVLQPYAADGMQAYPISPRVNSTAQDDSRLIQQLH